MKQLKVILITLLIGLMSTSHCYAQTAGNDEYYQLFIDFLKQEMHYHKDVVFYPFPFKDICKESPYKAPTLEKNPERIQQLIAQGIKYDTSDSCADYDVALKVPHRIKIQAMDENRYQAEAFVTLPDSSTTLHLNSINIGIPQSFDQLEVTLMRIEDNVAYLLIEDKSQLIDYSYTQPGYVDNEEKEEEDEEAWRLKYLANPYLRTVDISGSEYIVDISSFAKDSFRYFVSSRITGTARNAKGEVLFFETLAEDFHHYLWYRNMDMPYSSMKDDYKKLKERFPTPEGDSQYHPLFTVRLEASGHITNLNINILSRSTQTPLHLQMEENFAPYNYDSRQLSLEEMTQRIATIKNMSPDSVPSNLTVVPYAKHPRSGKLDISAFLPPCYNTQYGEAHLRFTRLTFPYKTDSMTLKRSDIQKIQFDASYFRQSIYGSALTLIEIPFPNHGLLTGEVEYNYPNYEAARYDLPQLPEGLRYENDTLFISKKTPADDENNTGNKFYYGEEDYYLPPSSLTAYDEAGKVVPAKDEYKADTYKIVFERPVKALISLWRKDSFKGAIPFSMPLPALSNQ